MEERLAPPWPRLAEIYGKRYWPEDELAAEVVALYERLVVLEAEHAGCAKRIRELELPIDEAIARQYCDVLLAKERVISGLEAERERLRAAGRAILDNFTAEHLDTVSATTCGSDLRALLVGAAPRDPLSHDDRVFIVHGVGADIRNGKRMIDASDVQGLLTIIAKLDAALGLAAKE